MGTVHTCCSSKDTDRFESAENQPKEKLPGGFDDTHLAEGEFNNACESRHVADFFYVYLDRSTGLRLGVDVDHSDTISLLIDGIDLSGLISEWNVAHPDQKVQQGDRIVEVNGRRRDVAQLVAECKKEQALKVGIQRGAYQH
uniref:PDZ domain-containing protein n=1 Tax=Zooxanthella nutricula TaxID=1333877 RepID=A0A6U6N8F2_9DINO